MTRQTSPSSKKESRRRKSIHVNLDIENHRKLADLAKLDRRHVTQYATIVLENHIQEMEYKHRAAQGSGKASTVTSGSVPPRTIPTRAANAVPVATIPATVAEEIMSDESEGWEGTSTKSLAGTKVAK